MLLTTRKPLFFVLSFETRRTNLHFTELFKDGIFQLGSIVGIDMLCFGDDQIMECKVRIRSDVIHEWGEGHGGEE
ncbi:MAG TPA: hypothetical protein DCP92_00020 [Nitrospiraceae bacterium]|nr:hypothetical protein [Nitrospiraceae bacterium]